MMVAITEIRERQHDLSRKFALHVREPLHRVLGRNEPRRRVDENVLLHGCGRNQARRKTLADNGRRRHQAVGGKRNFGELRRQVLKTCITKERDRIWLAVVHPKARTEDRLGRHLIGKAHPRREVVPVSIAAAIAFILRPQNLIVLRSGSEDVIANGILLQIAKAGRPEHIPPDAQVQREA